MIVFKCPICALKLQTDPSLTGRRVRCPKCRGVAVVLAPSAVRVMPPPLPAADGDIGTDHEVVEKKATAHAREAANDFHIEAEERETSTGPVPPERDFHLEADD